MSRDAEVDDPARRERGDIVRIVAGVVGLLLLVGFVTANSQNVQVNFLFIKHSVGLIWALLFSALLGALLAGVAIRMRQRRRGR